MIGEGDSGVQLRYRDWFDTFFAAISGRDHEFDVTDIPARLWPHLYLLQVEGERLTIRLTGDAIRQTFGRDLRGLDILQITHGPKSDDIKAGYTVALTEKRRVLMHRLVHFEEDEITRVVECGFAPLIQDDVVRRIVGCIFFDHARSEHAEYGKTHLTLERI